MIKKCVCRMVEKNNCTCGPALAFMSQKIRFQISMERCGKKIFERKSHILVPLRNVRGFDVGCET